MKFFILTNRIFEADNLIVRHFSETLEVGLDTSVIFTRYDKQCANIWTIQDFVKGHAYLQSTVNSGVMSL